MRGGGKSTKKSGSRPGSRKPPVGSSTFKKPRTYSIKGVNIKGKVPNLLTKSNLRAIIEDDDEDMNSALSIPQRQALLADALATRAQLVGLLGYPSELYNDDKKKEAISTLWRTYNSYYSKLRAAAKGAKKPVLEILGTGTYFGQHKALLYQVKAKSKELGQSAADAEATGRQIDAQIDDEVDRITAALAKM